MFHSPDTSLKRLNSCLKRADRFARVGDIDKSHKLYVPFSNLQWYLSGHDASVDRTDQFLQDMIALDWFALKVDNYAKDNMIDSDSTLHAMLHEWKKHLPFGTHKKKK